MQERGKYCIADTFKITGRGLVFAGYLTEGSVYVTDTIEFTAFNLKRQRKILGVEAVRKSPPGDVNLGLLIKCENDNEIEELRNWKPENVIVTIYIAEK